MYFLLISAIALFRADGFVPPQKPPVVQSKIFNPFSNIGSKIGPSFSIEAAGKVESSSINKIADSVSPTRGGGVVPVDKISSNVTDEPDDPAPKDPSLVWRGVVLGICLIWSTNFAVIKEIFQAAPTIDPSLYAAIRFSLASIVMLPRTFNSIGNLPLIASSMGVGVSVFFGYFGQSIGLLTTTANKSSFICSLNVVWVALVSSLIKKEFKTQALISAFLAVIGVAVLESDGNSPPVIGDLWSLCQPVGFGSGYLILEYVVAKYPDNPGAITAFKIFGIAILSIIWAAASGHTLADLQPIMESNIAVAGLLYTGIITTAAALWVQSYAFEEVAATDVSIILSTEPIFATLFAAGLIGEAITLDDCIGGAVILIACLSNEFNLYDNFILKLNENNVEKID